MNRTARHGGSPLVPEQVRKELRDFAISQFRKGVPARAAWKECKAWLNFSVHTVSSPESESKHDPEFSLRTFSYRGAATRH